MATAERILDDPRLEGPEGERELIRAAQSGSVEAIESLIEKYYPRVYSFIAYQTAGKREADDLTQEVFTRALGALERFNGRYQVGAWLMRIARNLMIDEGRKDGHRPQATDPADLAMLEPDPPIDNVWDIVDIGFSRTAVRRAISGLPPRQRTALLLREVEGMSYADIARVIGTNVRGVEGTLRRARRRFRLEMVDAEDHEGRQAVCRRTLRLIAASGSVPAEAKTHLRGCEDCRDKSQRTGAAEKALPALAPLGAAPPKWRDQFLATLRPETGRGLIESFRGGAQWFSAATSTMIEMAASIALAAALAGGPVVGNVIRTFHAEQVDAPAPAVVSAFSGVADELANSISPVGSEASPDGTLSAKAGSPGGSEDGSGLNLVSGLSLELTETLAKRYLGLSLEIPEGDLEIEAQLSDAIAGVGGLVDDPSLETNLLDLEDVEGAVDAPLAPDATVTVVSQVALPRKRYRFR